MPAAFLAFIFAFTRRRSRLMSVADRSMDAIRLPRDFPLTSSGANEENVDNKDGPRSSEFNAGASDVTLIST